MPLEPRWSSSVVVACAAAAAAVLASTSAAAQLSYTEGADLAGQSLGPVAVGDNAIGGALSAVLVQGPGGVPEPSGDTSDTFSFTVPAGVRVTALTLTLSNYSSSGALALYPGVQIVGAQYLFCTTTSGANSLTIPAPGLLAPGSYTFTVFTGLSGATNVVGNHRSFNYILNIRAEAETGACCNRWTGHCAVMTDAACGGLGLRYDGAGSVCSPVACRACPADFNGSGEAGVQDIFDFLAAYFAGC